MKTCDRRKLTVPQLARIWGVSPNKVTCFVRNGELRAVNLATKRHGRPRFAIDVQDVAEFEKSRQVQPAAACRQLPTKKAEALGLG